MDGTTITENQRSALRSLKPAAEQGFYLAGGTALVEPAELYEGIPVASLADIAAMKIEAIASRGARKDFYDLYFICEQLGGLPAAIQAFRTRFAKEHPDLLHRLKALIYFDDAEREPEPLLLRPASWQTLRGFFEQQVRGWWSEGRS